MRILFVCTANRIRSPLAEALARRFAAQNDLPIVASSAGFLDGGQPAVADMVDVAHKMGVDLSDHCSRKVDAAMLTDADLVVAMTGRHVVDLVGLAPGCVRRVLTLRELSTLTGASGAPRWEPAGVRSWVKATTERPISTILSGDLDVADPMGRPIREYRRTAAEIDALIRGALGDDPARGEPPW